MSSRRLEDQFLKDNVENEGGGNNVNCPDATESTTLPTAETLTAEGTPDASGTTYADDGDAQDPQCTPETGENIHINSRDLHAHDFRTPSSCRQF